MSERWFRRGNVLNLTLGAALVVVVMLIAWTLRGGAAEPTTAAQTTTVDTGAVTATVSANGNIAAGTTVNVDFESSGVVTDLLVKPGQKVRAGQLLARVDRTAALQVLERPGSSSDRPRRATTPPLRDRPRPKRDATRPPSTRRRCRSTEHVSTYVRHATVSP